MSDYKIRECFPASDEYFEVALIYEGETTRVFLSRVLMWCLVDLPHKIEHIEAITEQGMPGHCIQAAAVGAGIDVYYVKATDKSPGGRIWGEVFAETVPSSVGVHELSLEQSMPFQT